MKVLNFLSVPRAFGNPRQYIAKDGNPVVYDKKILIDLINKNNKINDVFVSANRFLSFIDRKPFQIEMSKIFLDFDGKMNPPIDALKDMRKVTDYYDEVGIPYLPVYSGCKGFHVYVPLKPKVYTNGRWLKDVVRSCMLQLKRELGIETIDPAVATPTKLCRVLYSTHPKTGRICQPLPKYEIIESRFFNRPIEKLINYNLIDSLENKRYLTLEEYIDYLDIDPEEEIIKLRESFALKVEQINYGNPDDQFLQEVLHYPCLINAIIGVENATHFARFMCCIHLKRLGYDPLWVFKFFKQRLYFDHMNEEECRYQINNIFQNDYIFPSCRRIQEEGMCIGAACPYYKK